MNTATQSAQESKLKQAKYDAMCIGDSAGKDNAKMDVGPSRPSLMERVYSQAHRSEQESRRFGRLQELQYLLEKNPEIARILDLVEEVR